MKSPSTILAVVGIIGVIAVAGYFYTQMKTFAPADITATQTIVATTTTTTNPVEWSQCKTNEDCVPVGGCCTYTTAVRKDAESAWHEKNPVSKECAVTECDKPKGTAACENGACVLKSEPSEPAAPTINPVSTPVEPVAVTPTAVPDDEEAAEDATENTPADNTNDVTGSDEAAPGTPSPDAADVDMPTDADMKPQGDLSGNQTVPVAEQPPIDADPVEWAQCTSDADCAPVGTECCAANYAHAVNNKFADAWIAKHPKQDCDPGAACIMMMPIAHCVSGLCTMKSNPQ